MNDEINPADQAGPTPDAPKHSRLERVFWAALSLDFCLWTEPAPAQTVDSALIKAGASARVWTSPPPGDLVRGATLYQDKCTACHAIDTNKTGPAHRSVLGRRVAACLVTHIQTN